MTTCQRLTKLQQTAVNRFNDVIVVLENIHDPHNGLASLRNCDAFGIQQVHFIFETEKAFNPKKMGKSSSSSANKWLDFTCWSTSRACFDYLKDKGYKLWATTVKGRAEKLWQVNFRQEKMALIFGNEHTGISDTAKHRADKLIYIPMYGFVESLNLSVAVGITLYELNRQRRPNVNQPNLSDYQKLVKRWLKL